MKRFFVIITVFFIIPIFSSCCIEHYNITDIYFGVVGEINEEGATLIEEKLEFYITSELEYNLEGVIHNNLQKLSNVCYATSCGMKLDNSLVVETFSMHLDKSFQYKNEIIIAGSNLFDIEEIKNQIIINENEDFDIIKRYTILFSNLFFHNTDFEGNYIVTFSCKTSDNLFFEKNVLITFRAI